MKENKENLEKSMIRLRDFLIARELSDMMGVKFNVNMEDVSLSNYDDEYNKLKNT